MGSFFPTELEKLGTTRKEAWLNTVLTLLPILPAGLKEEKDSIQVLALSDYVARIVQKYPLLLVDLWQSGELKEKKPSRVYQQSIEKIIEKAQSEADLARELRIYRQREMVRIIWRHFTQQASLDDTISELSYFADQTLAQSLHWLTTQWAKHYKLSETPPSLLIIALGKLGAQELNLSSDIDLMYVSPIEGSFLIPDSAISYQQFYEKIAQRLTMLLHESTEEGFVFRVDLRLRPYGSSGPLVMSVDALENYYSEQGRDWERYALIKARIITGDDISREQVEALIRPFVYRRYIDFGAINALREMHQLIRQEVRNKALTDDIKRGPGGIREIEFIAQAFQLIRGGREASLRERKLQEIMNVLMKRGFLKKETRKTLMDAYIFLRDTEHCLQAFHDQQTHLLPEHPLDKTRLAFAMQCSSWDNFMGMLLGHRNKVEKEFNDLGAIPPSAAQQEVTPKNIMMQNLWQGVMEQQDAEKALQELGFEPAKEIIFLLDQFSHSTKLNSLTAVARQRLDTLMPLLLEKCMDQKKSQAKETLLRVTSLIQAILKRSAYLALLIENPQALEWVVTLCAKSRMISDELTQNPALLDELLNLRVIRSSPQKGQLKQDLENLLSRQTDNDLEVQMEVLRYFKQVNVLRVAAANVMDWLPLMRVSDSLTDIAEVIIELVSQLAFEQLRDSFPAFSSIKHYDELPFGIIAYGKLAGYELGYASDLDLVFVYDEQACANQGESDFYLRWARRIVHLMSTRTHTGILYQVDTQLRPLGQAGLMVSSLNFFEEYLATQAWTWEHQALVRSRILVGNKTLRAQFILLRRKILQKERNRQTLSRETREMRDRMRAKNPTVTGWDIKAGLGGIIDIEFLAQYLVLCFAATHLILLRYPDTMRILDFLEAATLLPANQAQTLRTAYCTWRDALHALHLQQLPGVMAPENHAALREKVIALWNEWLEDNKK